jgi:isopropylmalate/homocitrate/citramalate synthase
LIQSEVVSTSEKAPIVGSNIFSTQAGLHQTGVQRQDEAPGGLIYLPFAPRVVGRQEVELNRIGALSGMDGIVAVLNRERCTSDPQATPLTVASRLAKLVYDKVHDAYDGRYDETQDRYVDYRTTFFEGEELAELAKQTEAVQP